MTDQEVTEEFEDSAQLLQSEWKQQQDRLKKRLAKGISASQLADVFTKTLGPTVDRICALIDRLEENAELTDDRLTALEEDTGSQLTQKDAALLRDALTALAAVVNGVDASMEAARKDLPEEGSERTSELLGAAVYRFWNATETRGALSLAMTRYAEALNLVEQVTLVPATEGDEDEDDAPLDPAAAEPPELAPAPAN